MDALIRALALPLGANEEPRARADFLLCVLETTRPSEPRGSDGRSLRTAAVEALLSLGYPYALEVPREALEELARDLRKTVRTSESNPTSLSSTHRTRCGKDSVHCR